MQFPLTGPFSSLGPFTFGPWYYYQLILFTRLVPVAFAPWVYMGLASTLFILIMFFIGDQLEGKRLGLILALLSAVSPSQVSTGLELVNPNLISLYAGICTLLFIYLYKNNASYYWSALLGFALGIGINHHYQMSGLLIFPVLLLLAKPKKYYYFLFTLAGIFVSFLPLLFFDMNNHWFNMKNIIYFYTEGRKAFYVPNRWLTYIKDFLPSFWAYTLGIPKVAGIIIALGSLLLFLYQLASRKLSKPLILIGIAFLSELLLLRYYWGERSFGYLQFLYPFVFICSGYLLSQIAKMKFGYPLVLVLLMFVSFFAIREDFNSFTPGGFENEIHATAKNIEEQFPNEKISLFNCKYKYNERAQGVAAVLAFRGKMGESGKKVGFSDSHCETPETEFYKNPSSNPLERAKIKDTFYPGNNVFRDFTIASVSALAQTGWDPINPKVVFTSVTRWWFTEQP